MDTPLSAPTTPTTATPPATTTTTTTLYHELAKQAPWDISAQMLAHPKYLECVGGGEDAQTVRMRMYRLFVQRLAHANYPDVPYLNERCNFWLLFCILCDCQQPFQDSDTAHLWSATMLRMHLARHGIKGVTVESLGDSVPGSSVEERSTFLHVGSKTPGNVLPQLTDTEFWNAVSYIPPATIEHFACRHYKGPRAYRMDIQTMPANAEQLFTAEPPSTGQDLVLRAAFARDAFPEEASACDRMAYIYQAPRHIIFA